MDNTRMFNKSFDDLSFIQNMSNDKERYIFVFDFDLTLTSKSSDGITKTKNNYIELFDSKNKIDKLKYYLNKIVESGNLIYVNTRALSSDVAHILKNVNIEVGDDKLVKGIKGSIRKEQILNPFCFAELEKYGLHGVTDGSVLWGVKKVIALNQIKDEENVQISNVFFFDDSVININTAKVNGYVNSFLIGSNDSGLFGLDFLLIKLSQILDILKI